ncbi:glutathione S-transferase-like isoform X2 [Homalodisca vitripennis]|uniref:glutathione S-transferase-like isoform X2 n=1 Tax=Homalodisca vitripennis TaxID=197043 RepID=UPI001EEA70E4|nr:glutathione S-transferase-like isoform X2 [Homalodisca vitripennis]
MTLKSKIKLTYFPARCLGEPIRFMLAYLGKEFEDHRCSAEEWLRIKHKLTSACVPATPWGKVPVLEIDGQQVTQNIPIVRYLGKEAGLGGKDNWEDLRIDEIVSVIDEFRVELAKHHSQNYAKENPISKDHFFNEKIPFYMKKLDAHIKKNNGYLANGKLSWADLYFGAMIEHMTDIHGSDITVGYPNIKVLKERVFTLPQIKAWLDKRPEDSYKWLLFINFFKKETVNKYLNFFKKGTVNK